MMYAIHRGRVGRIVDTLSDGVAVECDDGTIDTFPFGQDTIVDPTDDQLDAARDGRPIPRDPEADREVFEIMADVARTYPWIVAPSRRRRLVT